MYALRGDAILKDTINAGRSVLCASWGIELLRLRLSVKSVRGVQKERYVCGDDGVRSSTGMYSVLRHNALLSWANVAMLSEVDGFGDGGLHSCFFGA